MKNFEKLEKILEKFKIKYVLHDLSDKLGNDEMGVDEHVQALGMKYKEGLSTMIYFSKGKYYALLRRDDRNVDLKKLQKIADDKRISFASEKELKELGFEPGLATPLLLNDLNHPVKILADRAFLEMNRVVCGSTLKSTSLDTSKADILKYLEKYEETDVTVPNIKRQDGKILRNEEGKKKRILTGDTPTGRLHLGHYLGTLENRVKLQNEYETFILIANVHAYAQDYGVSEKINDSAYEVFLDNLAVGIDPKVSTIYLESGIPETYELYSLFLTMVTNARAMRNPSVKDEIKYKKLDPSMAFVSYPILQAADILQFGTDLVPVGEDQLPMIEQAREIARDFNKTYGETFVIPEGQVGRVARLVGTDGKNKMSKSGGNAILLSDDEETLRKKVMSVYTDPGRAKATDPGKVEGNVAFVYHDAFNPNKEEVAELKERYKKGTVGDVEVKERLFEVLNSFLAPIRERRKYYEERPEEAKQILKEGTERARKIVIETVEKVRERMGINKLIE